MSERLLYLLRGAALGFASTVVTDSFVAFLGVFLGLSVAFLLTDMNAELGGVR